MRCKSVTAIGLGPSLVGSGLGSIIDQQSIVVRTTVSPAYKYVTSKDYGGYATHKVTTVPQIDLLRHERPLAKSVWIYETWKGIVKEKIELLQSLMGDVVFESINQYIRVYLELYSENFNKEGDFTLYPSKGTAGVLTVIERLQPKDLYLLGFDAVFSGEQYGKNRPNHDFVCEGILVALAAKKHNVELHWWGHEDNFSGFFDKTQDN